MEKDIQINRNKFINDFNKSHNIYLKNKKDYLNLYILSTLAIASESSIKRKTNDYDKHLDKVALEHLINCEDIVNDLSIGNSYLNKKNKISDLINYFKKFFNDSNSGKV